MSSIIRANTDQLRSVARQMRGAADQILADTGASAREMEALAETWSGSARDRGMARWAEIHPRYQPAAEQLNHFASELDGLAARLEEAARVFGDGLGGTGSDSGGGKADNSWLDQAKKDHNSTIRPSETKMDGVFDLMQGRKNEKRPDLQIYQVGENEFVVLLQGSDMNQVGGMNPLLPNAFISGTGFSTAFTETIRTKLLDLAKKHPNANINLVGYSQGGIETQNLARDQSFWNNSGLNIASISTYGTPNTFSSPKVAYNYDAPGDIVSNYGTTLGGVAILSGLSNPNPLVQMATAVGVYKGVGVHTSDYFNDSPSKTRQLMAKDAAPWIKNNSNASREWVLYDSADDGDHSYQEVGKAVIANTMTKVGESAVNTYNAATKTVAQVADATGKAANNAVKEGGKLIGDTIQAVKQNMPGPILGFVGAFL